MMDEDTLRKIRSLLEEIDWLIPMKTFHKKNFEYAKQHLAEAYFWFSTTGTKEGE